jgi:homocysteine S-methyltransferase
MKKGLQLFSSDSGGNIINPFSLAVRLKRPLILDGAMGSFLHKKGFKPDDNLWFSYLNIVNPGAVKEVHSEYINAGADIITTNTFRTNPSAVAGQSRYNSSELVEAALRIAHEAVSGSSVLIAGSNPPAEDSYQKQRKLSYKELQLNHSRHIELLVENGCNFILNETQSHFDEIEIICRFCSDNNIPYVMSFYFDKDFRILSGENIIDVADLMLQYNPLAIGFNCVGPELFNSFLNKINVSSNWGFYLNYGLGDVKDKKLEAVLKPDFIDDLVVSCCRNDVSFIGGCCGSDPVYIEHIKSIVYGNNNS